MSESTENTAPSMCDQVLDYAYDELEGDAKAAFEAHLAGCKKCQDDLQSMKRVRGAVKSVLPSVEPPANATGALHAQLIHAAAQRASAAAGGGKVIPFGRRVQKVVLSPAFLAAAMFVIVGGAAGTMWWQGKFDMPAKHAEATAPVEAPAPAATPVVTAMPSGATATAEPEKAEKAKTELADDKLANDELPTRKVLDKKGSKISGAFDDSLAGNEGGGGENKVYLGGIGKDSKPVEVRRAAPAAHAAAKEAAAEKKPADLPAAKADAPAKKMAPAPEPKPMPKSAMKTRETDNAALDLDGAIDSNNGLKGRGSATPGGSGGGVLGGVATTGDTRSRRDQGVQPAAKPAGDKLAKREAPAQKPAPQAGPQGGTWNGQVSSLPPAATSAPAAPPPPVQQSIDGKVGGKSSTADQTWRNTTSSKQQAEPSFASPSTAQQPPAQGYMQQNSRNYTADRKKALDYADSGRCTDAVKVFEEMQKARWSLTSKEQTAYKRCKAREEATKQDKNFQNRMMQDAERVHEQNAAEEAPKAAAPAPVMESESQSVKAPSKAKKKAAPAADDAATKSGL